MKKSRFTEEQITYVLRQADAGTPVSDVCRGMGISEATLCVEEEVREHGRERAAQVAPA
jgi:hypothetical protein